MFQNQNLNTGIAASVGFLILLLLPTNLFFTPIESLDPFKVGRLGDSLKNLLIVIYGLFLIKRLDYIKQSGILNLRPRSAFLLLIPIYFLAIGPLQYALFGYTFESIQASDILILLVADLTVGISEEVLFRGFMVPHLIKGRNENESLIKPLFLSAFLFGGLHFLNLLSPEANTYLIISQVLYATMFGVGFGVLLLRTGSLLPIGLLHGLINFSSDLHKLPGAVEPAIMENYKLEEAIFSFFIVLPFFLFSLQQLKKVKTSW